MAWARNPVQRRWYQILTTTEPKAPSFVENLRASGKVNAARLVIHNCGREPRLGFA